MQQVIKVQAVFKVHLDLQASKEQAVQLGLLVRQVPQVIKVLVEVQGLQDLLERQDLQELQVIQDRQEPQDLLEPRD